MNRVTAETPATAGAIVIEVPDGVDRDEVMRRVGALLSPLGCKVSAAGIITDEVRAALDAGKAEQ